MRMHVDKSRRNDEAAGINLFQPLASRNSADRNDPVPFHCHVAIEPWISRSINDPSTADNQIEVSVLRAVGRRSAKPNRPNRQGDGPSSNSPDPQLWLCC